MLYPPELRARRPPLRVGAAAAAASSGSPAALVNTPSARGRATARADASATWGVGLGGKVKVMLDGWTGEADQDAIIEILRYSATRGEALLVVHWAGGYNDVMWGLDGWQDAVQLERRDGKPVGSVTLLGVAQGGAFRVAAVTRDDVHVQAFLAGRLPPRLDPQVLPTADDALQAAKALAQRCYQATQATHAGQPTAADPGPGESRAPALVQRMSDEGVAHRHVLAYLLEQAARGAVADFTEAFDVPEVGAAVVRGTLRPTPGSPAEAGQGAAMPEPIVLRVDRRDAGALFHAAHARVLTASLLVGG